MKKNTLTPKDLQTRYDKEAELYDQKRYMNPKGYYYERAEAILLRKLAGTRHFICDVATGTGKNIKALSNNCEIIIGVDISYNMLKIAQEKIKKYGIHNFALIQADANNLPFRNNCFDLVLATKFFYNVPASTHRTFFNEMSRISNKIVIIEILNKLMWFGIRHLLIKLRLITDKNIQRKYFLWQYKKITGKNKKKSIKGFGVGVPFSDLFFKYFPSIFKSINCILTNSLLKYFAPKLFIKISIE